MIGPESSLAAGPTRGLEAIDEELSLVRQMYVAYGFDLPDDLAPPAFLSVVSKPFMPNETPLVSKLKDISDGYADYVSREVHPVLYRAAEAKEPAALALARQVGRVIGAQGMQGPLLYISEPPLAIDQESFTVDHEIIAHDFDPGFIVEYGMGLRGIFTHLDNVSRDRYGVHAIHKLHGEVAALQGILDFHGISPEQLSLEAGGIASAVDGLLADGHGGKADLVVASRVHMAGDGLRYGVQHAGDLLRQDGILVARGPRRLQAPGVCNYDEVYQMVQEDPVLDLIMTKTIAAISSQDNIEPTRLVVAEKLGRV